MKGARFRGRNRRDINARVSNCRERLLRRQNRLGSDRISFGVSGLPCHAVYERDRDTFLKARVCLQFHAHLTRGLFLWFGPFFFTLEMRKETDLEIDVELLKENNFVLGCEGIDLRIEFEFKNCEI